MPNLEICQWMDAELVIGDAFRPSLNATGVTFGDGWVQLVEFTSSGARSEVLLTYGNASRPGSAHIADQLP